MLQCTDRAKLENKGFTTLDCAAKAQAETWLMEKQEQIKLIILNTL